MKSVLFEPETIRLKDGTSLLLRSVEEGDAAEMIAFLKQTAGESDNLLRTPEEVTLTVPEEEAFIRNLRSDSRSLMVNAVKGGRVIGNASLFPAGRRQRVMHRGETAVVVIREYWGFGLGRALMRALIHQAPLLGYERLELTVYADNPRAIRLYESLGFVPFGRLEKACKMPDGSFRDNLLMGLELNQKAEGKPEKQAVDAAALGVAEKLGILLRFETVASPTDGPEDEAAFSGCRQAILDLYPALAGVCETFLVKGRGLVLRWRGKAAGSPWVLMAHYDVVPAKEKDWEHPPFSGLVENGYVFGRGALDTKGTLACMLQAAQEMALEGFEPAHDVYFCFSGDEEIYGPTTGAIIDFLKERDAFPDFVLDEGGGLGRAALPGFPGLLAQVGVAEKGMAQVRLRVSGPGGHASRPPAETQGEVLVRAMERLIKKPFPMRLTPLTRAFLRALAPGSAFPWNTVYKYPDAFRGLLFERVGQLAGEEAALFSTTCALTQLSGSAASNVLPETVTAGYNLRLLPGDEPEACAKRLAGIISDARVEVTLAAGNKPSPVSSLDGHFGRVQRAVAAVWPEAVTAPSLMVGATDAYFYSLMSEHVYRFSPLLVSEEERACVHAANERVPVRALQEAVNFYKALLRD